MFGNPMEIVILVGAAVLLFGADRVPKLARGIGAAKKEFMVGQAEADVAAERVRAEARAAAEAQAAGQYRAPSEGTGPPPQYAPQPGAQSSAEYGTMTAETAAAQRRAAEAEVAAAETRSTAEARAEQASRLRETPSANGIIMGAPSVPPEPPLPRD